MQHLLVVVHGICVVLACVCVCVCVCSRSLTAFALSGQLYEPDFNTKSSCLHIVIANVLSSTYT